MPRGGRRAGAGRKSDTELLTARSLIDEAITRDEWVRALRGLLKLGAKEPAAMALLLRYRFGVPLDMADGEAVPVRLVVYAASDDRGRADESQPARRTKKSAG